MRVTVSQIVNAVGSLPNDVDYSYIDPNNHGLIRIDSVIGPEGPIAIRRYDPSKGGSPETAKRASISTGMLQRIANAIVPGEPFNIDRILAASGNTRSALESLMSHTPQFYYCRPGRMESGPNGAIFKEGHKHLLWLPSDPHPISLSPQYKATDKVISEIANVAIYDSLDFEIKSDAHALPEEDQRMHSFMQIALTIIGIGLGSQVYIAKNDQTMIYGDKRVGEITDVIADLSTVKLVATFDKAALAGRLIDCIWFRNSKFMPAVFEVEHSTGVTSGLSRMKNFKDLMPPIKTRFVVAAPDEARSDVMKKANQPQFKDLRTFYFPYSGIQELYSLVQRRKIRPATVTDEFLDSFMESTEAAS